MAGGLLAEDEAGEADGQSQLCTHAPLTPLASTQVFDEHYLDDYKKAGLLDRCGGELPHLISDAATMQIIRWTDGGFGMAAVGPPLHRTALSTLLTCAPLLRSTTTTATC